MVVADDLNNVIQGSCHHIRSEDIPLRNSLPILFFCQGGSSSFFRPLMNPVLRTVCKHSAAKITQKVAKNNTKEMSLVQKKIIK